MPACVVPLIVAALLIFFLVLIVRANQREAERERKRQEERKRRRKEAERKRREKYIAQTPARRALICQLYADGIDLKEITFILRRAGYNSPTGEPITMKEIMEEHADMQIEKHKGQQTGNVENVTEQA